jgi:L-malate glycosyltransferase
MHRRIKVLFLHTGDNWLRGSEGVLLAVLSRLDLDRFEPRVICSQPAMAAAVSALGINVERRDFPQMFAFPGEVSLPVRKWVVALRALCQTVREYAPDVIYCNSGSSNQLGILAGKRTGVPVVTHLHSPYTTRYVLWYGIRHSSLVICVSRAVASMIGAKVRFSRPPAIIYNGVDTNRFCPAPQRDPDWRRRLGVPEDAIVFGQVSSLISRKGVDLLLRARARGSDSYLVFVGEGPERAAFEALANELGIASSVRFVGLADPVAYYQHVFDVSVLPSRNDALPLSLIEAGACGLPSIGARVHGIPEIIEHEVNGLLFDPDNVDDLARAMTRMQGDAEFRRKTAATALEIARSRFSLERQVREIEDTLELQANVRSQEYATASA